MSGEFSKKIAAVLASFALLGAAYYGSYLPYKKSRAFIAALMKTPKTSSVAEYTALFSEALAVKSPIGKEEIVRSIANNLLGGLQQTDNPNVIAEIIAYVHSIYDPIIARGKGMSFMQNLYILGVMHEAAFVKTNDSRYLDAALDYFNRGFEVAPKRPQFLFGLFDVYRFRKDNKKAEDIARLIVAQWPDIIIQKANDASQPQQ